MEGRKLMSLALQKMLEVLVVCIGAVIIDSVLKIAQRRVFITSGLINHTSELSFIQRIWIFLLFVTFLNVKFKE